MPLTLVAHSPLSSRFFISLSLFSVTVLRSLICLSTDIPFDRILLYCMCVCMCVCRVQSPCAESVYTATLTGTDNCLSLANGEQLIRQPFTTITVILFLDSLVFKCHFCLFTLAEYTLYLTFLTFCTFCSFFLLTRLLCTLCESECIGALVHQCISA